MDAILFSSKGAPEFRFLSNFFPVVLVCEQTATVFNSPLDPEGGKGLRWTHWRSMEHYYQAAKFCGTLEKECIRSADTPGKAKQQGRLIKATFLGKAAWNAMRLEVMEKGLRSKFDPPAHSLNLFLKHALLDTGNRELIEDTADPFWGRGRNGKGLNMLGKLLMKIRAELRGEKLPEVGVVAGKRSRVEA